MHIGCPGEEGLQADEAKGKEAFAQLESLVTSGLLEVDLGKLPTRDKRLLGLVMAATVPGLGKDSTVDLDVPMVESRARSVKQDTEVADRHFYFSFHKTTSKESDVEAVQVSIESKYGVEGSHTYTEIATKTGYFDKEGNMLCLLPSKPVIRRE